MDKTTPQLQSKMETVAPYRDETAAVLVGTEINGNAFASLDGNGQPMMGGDVDWIQGEFDAAGLSG